MIPENRTTPVPVHAAYSLVYELADMSDLYMAALDELLCCVDAAADAGLSTLSIDELLWLYADS